MIVERNEFRVKFGMMKDALATWKEIFEEMKGIKDAPRIRIMTDMTGPAYTLVLELEIRDFIQIGFKNYQWGANSKAAELYRKFVPLCESSERILYKIEMQS
jgi:hypothetical protein